MSRLFGVPDFRRLWIAGLGIFVARWIETLSFGVFAWQHTGSPFTVAMLTMLRLLPMGLFGGILGAAAERVERRSMMLVVVLGLLVVSSVLAVLAAAGQLAVWHLAIAAFCNGIGWATDNPVRRMMIGEVVGAERMSAAMAWDIGANNASRMLGPGIGGVLLAVWGIGACSVACAVLYAVAAVATFNMRYRNAPFPLGGAAVLARVAEALSLARRDRRLFGILAVTMIYNLFGWPFTSMVPVIAQHNLHLGAGAIGILASMDGVGAICGAVAMALRMRPALFARAYVGGTAVYLAGIAVFALVPQALPAGGALWLTGLAGAAYSIMQSTLVYLASPVEMRSRMLGLLSVCIGIGPIGFLQLGLLADAIGAPWATAAIAGEGLLALLLTRGLWRAI